jgi:hypothetical protein
MIPAKMAELMLRSGGLTEWINSDEKRPKRVREQPERRSTTASDPVPHLTIDQRRNKRLVALSRKHSLVCPVRENELRQRGSLHVRRRGEGHQRDD